MVAFFAVSAWCTHRQHSARHGLVGCRCVLLPSAWRVAALLTWTLSVAIVGQRLFAERRRILPLLAWPAEPAELAAVTRRGYQAMLAWMHKLLLGLALQG